MGHEWTLMNMNKIAAPMAGWCEGFLGTQRGYLAKSLIPSVPKAFSDLRV